jgi:crotonobetainyl-CoA:carnitine CoA-transferase CaiB-like acyl-CoA transferase
MTMRTVIGTWCALLMFLGPAQAQGDWFAEGEMACAARTQRETHIRKVNERLDWFLSIVEEVPEDVARQFDLATKHHLAWKEAIAHPQFRASQIRVGAADIKRVLGPPPQRDTRAWRARDAIAALAFGAELLGSLELYAVSNPGRRIVDTTKWSEEALELVETLHTYADCLVAELTSRLLPADAR